mmetsp:Transcript_103621/g.269921  ORF Transcript_103621/g.269921 Transcript_103621/m.269921 type:complete len:231 (+) Transcript_103621:175-867(+)
MRQLQTKTLISPSARCKLPRTSALIRNFLKRFLIYSASALASFVTTFAALLPRYNIEPKSNTLKPMKKDRATGITIGIAHVLVLLHPNDRNRTWQNTKMPTSTNSSLRCDGPASDSVAFASAAASSPPELAATTAATAARRRRVQRAPRPKRTRAPKAMAAAETTTAAVAGGVGVKPWAALGCTEAAPLGPAKASWRCHTAHAPAVTSAVRVTTMLGINDAMATSGAAER